MTRPLLVPLFCIGLTVPLGCSVLFTEGPPAGHARLRYFDCTSSRMAPATDLVVAGLLALATLGASQDPGAGHSEAITMGGMTVGLLGSAVYGWVQTDSCREAKNELALRTNDSESPRSAPPTRADPWLAGGPVPKAPPSTQPVPEAPVVPSP